jgi:hypothetical protein
MARSCDGIDEHMAAFLRAQHVFFAGTAPARAEGQVNVSPKGLGSFRILDPTRAARGAAGQFAVSDPPPGVVDCALPRRAPGRACG